LKIAFARVTKLTDIWGRIITLITGGPYKHTEIVFSKKATYWYMLYLVHARMDYYTVWRRKSQEQIHSACIRTGVQEDKDAIREGDLRLCFSSSIQDKGIRLKLIDLEPKKWDFISCDSDLDMERETIAWCEIQVDRKYDLLGLGGFVFCHLKLFKPSRKKAWCSEITEDVLYHTGHLQEDRTSVRQCPKAKWYRPPSPVALWNRVKKLKQPLESMLWTT